MPRIRAEQSVLVVIDTQPGFYRGRDDVAADDFAAFVERVAWLTAVARGLDVPTVVTVERPDRNGPTAEAVLRSLPPGARALEKATFDVCGEQHIRSAIEDCQRSTAVLVGMETDVCVAQSALGLADLGMRVAVAADATFSPGAAHAHGLERLRGIGAEIVSTKGLRYEWLPSVAAVRAFKQSHPELARPVGLQL